MNIQAILADKWVRIGGGILAVIFAVTFFPAIFGWIPDGGLIFFNIVLALVFFNMVVQRHPIMSLRWLYGIDLGLGVLLLLAALPAFSESALAGITALILIPLNCWTGYHFIKEMGRTASLQGTFLPTHEGGLTLEFTNDGNLILSNDKVYRYATRRNDLLLYDGGTLVTQWEIAKCDMKTLMVKDDQGKLHEYKRDLTTATSTASVGSTGLGTVWEAIKYSQENARLQAKWTAQGGSSPSIEFTEDGAFVRSDGKAGKYAVDWTSKTISVTLTDKTQLVFEIISLSPTQLVLSENGSATTYTTTVGKRLGISGGNATSTASASKSRPSPRHNVWHVPESERYGAFQIVDEASLLAFEDWRFDADGENLECVVTLATTTSPLSRTAVIACYYDDSGVEVDTTLLSSGSSEFIKGTRHKAFLPLGLVKSRFSKVVIKRKR